MLSGKRPMVALPLLWKCEVRDRFSPFQIESPPGGIIHLKHTIMVNFWNCCRKIQLAIIFLSSSDFMESLLGNHDIVFGLGDSKICHTYSGCERYFDNKILWVWWHGHTIVSVQIRLELYWFFCLDLVLNQSCDFFNSIIFAALFYQKIAHNMIKAVVCM